MSTGLVPKRLYSGGTNAAVASDDGQLNEREKGSDNSSIDKKR